MCRLLSTFGKPKNWFEIILEFQKQANTGEIPPILGVSLGHKDGWGMAKSNSGTSEMEIVGKYLGSAMESIEYKRYVDSFSTPPHVFMCHLRKASPGIQISANAHPFLYGKWAFSHNGTVYEASELKSDSKFRITSDDSDSELYFHYLLTYILNEEVTQTFPEKIIEALININVPFNSLNSMFSNGSELYAIRYCTKFEDYYSLSYYETTDGIVISSEPVHIPELKASSWKEIPNRSIIKVSGDPFKKEIFQF
ncbi:MAG: class II glutamine amidotransferase [Candidatus Hodarchaeales archaeon]